MKPIHEQYEEETGKRWFTNPVCHGEVAYASWEYQKWLEERASRMRQTLSDVQELCKKTMDSHRKLSEFGGGGHYGHNVACNYQREYDGKTFCNCGVSDLVYAAKLAEKIKEHIG